VGRIFRMEFFPMNALKRILAMSSAAVTFACTPSLNWREVPVPGGSVVAMFPCRTEEYEREVKFDGQVLRMRLLSCQAAGSTFAVAQVHAPSVTRADELSRKLLASLKANVSGRSARVLAWSIPGAAGQPARSRESWMGSLADGASIQLEVGAFSSDTSAYQVTVSGKQFDPEAADLFFSSLKVLR